MPGTLYVVATPIGNLEDFTPRGARVLREAAVIAAEDTRTTRKLLSHFDIHTPLTSYHAHSTAGKADGILQRLLDGDDVALVSDAGTPGISDPGGLLIRAAVEAGVTVSPIPGASAVPAALSASGLDPSRFLFEGFLPRASGDRKEVLRTLRPLPHTLVFYEAPGRVAETLADLREGLGNRPACLAREITKRFEEFVRGPLDFLEQHCRAETPRGECVLLVAGVGEGDVADAADVAKPTVDVDARLEELLRGGASVRDVARIVADETKQPRKVLYALATRLAERLRAP